MLETTGMAGQVWAATRFGLPSVPLLIDACFPSPYTVFLSRGVDFRCVVQTLLEATKFISYSRSFFPLTLFLLSLSSPSHSVLISFELRMLYLKAEVEGTSFLGSFLQALFHSLTLRSVE